MTTVPRDLGICSFIPCGDPVKNIEHQLCVGHYKQWFRGKPLHVKVTTSRAQRSRICSYPGCENPSGWQDGPLCSPHGRQEQKGYPLHALRGQPCEVCGNAPAMTKGACAADVARARRGEIVVAGILVDKRCDSEHCDRLVTAESKYCASHRMRRHRGMDVNGKLSDRLTAPDRICPVVGCEELAETRTGMKYCPRHAGTFRRTGRPEPVGAGRQFAGRECFVTGCTEVQFATGMCQKHKMRAGNYDLTVLQYEALVVGAKCRICGKGGRLHIDHDHACCNSPHSCGKCIRGMLCRACNHGLGNFQDSRESLLAAIAYLEANERAA